MRDLHAVESEDLLNMTGEAYWSADKWQEWRHKQWHWK